MCLNARSLCIEKSNELLAVVRTNDVGYVCVTYPAGGRGHGRGQGAGQGR